jgi:hypothetical protein
MLLNRSSVDAGLVRDPVDFPVLAAVVRERLLEMWRFGHQRGPVELDQDAFVIAHVLRVELAMTRLELSDLRYHDESVPAVGPIEAPLVRLGIEKPHRETLDVLRGTL